MGRRVDHQLWAQGKMAKVVEAFRRGGGEGKPMILKAEVSYADSDEIALKSAWEEWKTNIFESSLLGPAAHPG
jgi:coenzyme F420-dependent glucose-6-phosphate dehydrogenase